MEDDLFTVSQLAELSGVTPRTIRYYDKIDLLKPILINDNGYRKYSVKELDRLQQILYFKQFGFDLAKIKQMLISSDYNIVDLLKSQQVLLEKEVEQKQQLLSNLKKTISYYKGEVKLSSEEKFSALKSDLISQNESKYGKEIDEKYGENEHQYAVNQFKGLTRKQYEMSKDLEKSLLQKLDLINQKGLSIDSDTAKKAFIQHQQWLKIFNDRYTTDYHLAMAELYTNDERFAKYYNSRSETNVIPTLNKIIKNYAQ